MFQKEYLSENNEMPPNQDSSFMIFCLIRIIPLHHTHNFNPSILTFGIFYSFIKGYGPSKFSILIRSKYLTVYLEILVGSNESTIS